MQKVMIVGAGKDGTSILKLLLETELYIVGSMIDHNLEAEGIIKAKESGITVGADWREYLDDTYDLVIDVMRDESMSKEIRKRKAEKTVLVPGALAVVISRLLEEKESLISILSEESQRRNTIFDSIEEGMVVIDCDCRVVWVNKSAEKMIGVKQQDTIGKMIQEVIPNTRLPIILESKETEMNKEQTLKNGVDIITTRIPMFNDRKEVIGAFAVFKDITEVVNLAEEVTNLKEVQTMLEAIIHSSDDAISVVDEQGRGILVNPAYSRITGLTKQEIIGKPATVDIYEGESMHMKVLQTRRAVRGTKMLVGPNKKEVIVNVAPIIVDGKLKGSVGVIHDVTEIKELTAELDRARQIIRTLEAKYSFDDIVGNSEEVTLALEQAKLGARTPATILLRGESGTGKELFAHAIHNASDRKFNKFVRVNCGAIAESLLESELFGYEEGAFTNARRGGKKGLFEAANNGSIFLDEIGEMSPRIQVKLLRILQENEFMRVGGTKPISVNVRVIAATNVNLEKAIMDGRFREDLYYRLSRMPIHIPPLRQRKEDLQELAARLIRKLNQEYGRNIAGLTDAALMKLQTYDWPGNVRELENVLGRSMIFMKYHETYIDQKHIPDFLEKQPAFEIKQHLSSADSGSLQERVEKYERDLILESLQRNNGNKTAAAKEMNISIRSLYYKLHKYNLENISMQ